MKKASSKWMFTVQTQDGRYLGKGSHGVMSKEPKIILVESALDALWYAYQTYADHWCVDNNAGLRRPSPIQNATTIKHKRVYSLCPQGGISR